MARIAFTEDGTTATHTEDHTGVGEWEWFLTNRTTSTIMAQVTLPATMTGVYTRSNGEAEDLENNGMKEVRLAPDEYVHVILFHNDSGTSQLSVKGVNTHGSKPPSGSHSDSDLFEDGLFISLVV